MVRNIDVTVFGDAPQLGDLARERVRKHGLALHQPTIAIGGFLARIASVDEHDLLPALLQMRGDRDTHHPGAENDDIGLHPHPQSAAILQT
jgi:hypothetical protein